MAELKNYDDSFRELVSISNEIDTQLETFCSVFNEQFDVNDIAAFGDGKLRELLKTYKTNKFQCINDRTNYSSKYSVYNEILKGSTKEAVAESKVNSAKLKKIDARQRVTAAQQIILSYENQKINIINQLQPEDNVEDNATVKEYEKILLELKNNKKDAETDVKNADAELASAEAEKASITSASTQTSAEDIKNAKAEIVKMEKNRFSSCPTLIDDFNKVSKKIEDELLNKV